MPSDATTLSLATAPAATLSGHPLPVVVTTPPALAPPPPGTFPYTRGLYPEMYRSRLWTMRMFAGFGSPEDTNARFKLLLDQGQTGLSTAFDMPTLMGLDPDHPLALGEVGREGVSVAHLDDMRRLFDGIDLGAVSTSTATGYSIPTRAARLESICFGIVSSRPLSIKCNSCVRFKPEWTSMVTVRLTLIPTEFTMQVYLKDPMPGPFW